MYLQSSLCLPSRYPLLQFIMFLLPSIPHFEEYAPMNTLGLCPPWASSLLKIRHIFSR